MTQENDIKANLQFDINTQYTPPKWQKFHTIAQVIEAYNSARRVTMISGPKNIDDIA